MVGRALVFGFPMRSCISRAALLVKVTARIFAAGIPRSIRREMREVITRVFPEPAPARIKTGPLIVSTALRCSGFSPAKLNIDGQFNLGRKEGKSVGKIQL